MLYRVIVSFKFVTPQCFFFFFDVNPSLSLSLIYIPDQEPEGLSL